MGQSYFWMIFVLLTILQNSSDGKTIASGQNDTPETETIAPSTKDEKSNEDEATFRLGPLTHILSPATTMFKPMIDILKPITQGTSSSNVNVNNNENIVSDSISKIMSPVTDIFKPMTDIFQPVTETTSSSENVVNNNANTASNIKSSITDVFKPLQDIFQPITEDASNNQDGGSNGGIPARKGLISKVIKSGFEMITKPTHIITQTLPTNIISSSIASTMSTPLNIGGMISGIAGFAGDKISSLTKIGECLFTIGSFVAKGIWSLFSNFPIIINMLKNICKIIVDLLSKFAYNLTMGLNCIRNIGRAIRAVFQAIKDFIWSIIKRIFRFLTSPIRWIFKSITFLVRWASKLIDFLGIILDVVHKAVCRLFVKPISFVRYILRSIGTHWILDPIRFVKTLIHEVILFPWNKHYNDLFRSEMPVSTCIPGHDC